MDTVRERFNLYLLLALAALLVCGCQTGKKKPVATTLRVHAEATEDTSFSRKVKIFKDESVTMKIHEMPMLSELDLTEAKIVEAMGGFAIALKFNPMGRWTLDHHTSLNIGRHLAIFVMFGEKPAVSRWIAAPIISHRTSDGMIIFTPDCTREEAEQIILGLNTSTKDKKPEKDAEAEAQP